MHWWKGKTKVLRDKTAPVPIILTQIPHWLTWDGNRAAYYHFIHAFGNGRRSYASETMAKRTVRCIKKCHRHHVDIM